MFQLNASRISAAGSDFIGPKIPAAWIRRSIEKVVIVLADVVPRVINRVRRRLGRVVNDGHGSDRRRPQTRACRIAQVDIEGLRPFDERVFVDEHGDTLGGLAGREAQRADRRNVVPALAGRNV